VSHRRSVQGDGFTEPSAEALPLCLVSVTFFEEHEAAEIDAQGVGRLKSEDVGTHGDRWPR
jgi:hypothetical protein